MTETMTNLADVSIEDLEDALGAAERDFEALRAEQRGMAGRISEAAHLEAGSAEALVAATARHDALPTLLFAAQCQVLRSNIALKTARKDAYSAQVPPLKLEVEALREAARVAKQESFPVARQLTHAASRVRSLRREIAQAEQELGELIEAHGKQPGRVVRSLW